MNIFNNFSSLFCESRKKKLFQLLYGFVIFTSLVFLTIFSLYWMSTSYSEFKLLDMNGMVILIIGKQSLKKHLYCIVCPELAKDLLCFTSCPQLMAIHLKMVQSYDCFSKSDLQPVTHTYDHCIITALM